MELQLRPKTRFEMATEYSVCIKTFLRMLHDYGITLEARKLIGIQKQIEIYSKLGKPSITV